MSIPLSGKDMYDDLVNHRFGLDVASITEVEIGDYGLSTSEIFKNIILSTMSLLFLTTWKMIAAM